MKDILNSLYPLEAPASDAPAEGDVAGAPAAEAGETGETAEATVEGVEPTSEPASEAVVAASPSSGTPMDNMETLPLMPDVGRSATLGLLARGSQNHHSVGGYPNEHLPLKISLRIER